MTVTDPRPKAPAVPLRPSDIDDLAFGEVDLGDGWRLVITKTPAAFESVITISSQRLGRDGRIYETEAEIVLGATAAQCMADIVTAFVRGTKRGQAPAALGGGR